MYIVSVHPAYLPQHGDKIQRSVQHEKNYSENEYLPVFDQCFSEDLIIVCRTLFPAVSAVPDDAAEE